MATRVNGWAGAARAVWWLRCRGAGMRCQPQLHLCGLFSGLPFWGSRVPLQGVEGVEACQEGDGQGVDGVIVMVCWYLPRRVFGLGMSQLQENFWKGCCFVTEPNLRFRWGLG